MSRFLDWSYGRNEIAIGAVLGMVFFGGWIDIVPGPTWARALAFVPIGVVSGLLFREIVTFVGAVALANEARKLGDDVAICEECQAAFHHEIDPCPECGGEPRQTEADWEASDD